MGSHFEQEVSVGEVFAMNEMVDTIAITRGHGTTGVIKRFGVTRLPRKTHRGLRKVACIVPGIHLPLSGLSAEVVIKVTSTEPTSTRRSTELVRVPSEEPRTTPLPIKTQMSRTLPQSVASHTTVLSTRTSSSLRAL